ncbi:MAG: UDP-N-acetylmuramate dehydrogenase [Desulfofustis sp.]|jgi:UDP-N-acetylmuramate dehydrogenase|nr:UDP-N-acetylmuramate dehydrogenase [Desulfofustis sp.]
MNKSMSSSQQAVLTGAVRGKIQWDAPLSAWTTYRIGGPADALVTLLDAVDLQAALAFCRRERVAWKVLGRGSNVLAPDEGFRGVVMILGDGFKKIRVNRKLDSHRVAVHAGAAVGMTRLANWCRSEGLAGFEFAAGIPGSVGGGTVVNAGAWGRSMADVIDAIEITDELKREIVRAKNLTFRYRKCDCSELEKNASVIIEVVLNLSPGDPQRIGVTMRDLQALRRDRQPQGLPCAGSVFKNPIGASAGKLIDDAGLKGMRVGDAQVSETHANFIVNCGTASARDVQSLIAEIQRRVLNDSGIALEPEIEIL